MNISSVVRFVGSALGGDPNTSAQQMREHLPCKHRLATLPPHTSCTRRRCELVLILLLFSVGCSSETLDTTYGARTGPDAGPSVNGTAVLADMLEQAGHKVSTRSSLSPALHASADCIVWFPDDGNLPNFAVRSWLENWLTDQPGRTVIYVGREFDAEHIYWQTIEPNAPADQQTEVKRRRVVAEKEFNRHCTRVVDGDDCDWFVTHQIPSPRRVTTLTGPWSTGIDSKQSDIEVCATYTFPVGDPSLNEVLLRGDNDVLVARQKFPAGNIAWNSDGEGTIAHSQLIVVTNGSFLLNLPLVNHQHRKLAARLIGELNPADRVVFLESGSGGPTIHDTEPELKSPNGLAFFSVWPLGIVLVHLAVAGILFCFARLPIFGVPRDPPPQSTSDFGKHVTALGDLLRLTQDHRFAETKVEQYRQNARGQTSGSLPSKRQSS